MEPIVKNEIRIDLVYGLIKENWKKFFYIMLITSIIVMALLSSIPRFYAVSVKLAPETNSASRGSSLSSAAAMFGISVSSKGGDAIVPEFYPDIVNSYDFLVPMMDVKVETLDGDFKGSYSEYILKRKKTPWWTKLIGKVKKIFAPKSAPYKKPTDYKVDPFRLTKTEYYLLQTIAGAIDCSVDNKTGIITLGVREQDPLIAADMAVLVKERLQEFITKYRTEKDKIQLEYATAVCDTAYVRYLNAQKNYAEYVDEHQGLSRQIYKVEEERLSGEAQLAFNIYNSLCQQKLQSEAELQKSTPVFTVLQNASVPIKPVASKKLIKTAIMAFLSAIVYLVILILKNEEKGNTNL